jgi:hypothetical protein
MVGQQWQDTARSPGPEEGRAPQTTPRGPSQTPPAAALDKLRIVSSTTSQARRASTTSPSRRVTFQTSPSASSRADASNVLRLRPPHPLLSLPLCFGGPFLRVPDANCGTILCRCSLLNRCFRVKHHRDAGGLCSSVRLPRVRKLKTKASSINFSTSVTREHASSMSPSTRLATSLGKVTPCGTL